MTIYILQRFIVKSILILPLILLFSAPIFSQSFCNDFMDPMNCVIPPSWYNNSASDNSTFATDQVGEPRPNYPLDTTPLNTNWYRITPFEPGIWTIDTTNTNPNRFNTELAVYRDNNFTVQFANLSKIGHNDDWAVSLNPNDGNCTPYYPIPIGVDPDTSCVRVFMTPPYNYYIQIDGVGSQKGEIKLNFKRIAPTAAAVSVAGRIKDSNGHGLGNTSIRLTNADGNIRTTISNQFGYYSFKGIEAGQTVIVEAQRKGFQFNNNPRVINLDDSLTELNFEGFSNSFYKRE